MSRKPPRPDVNVCIRMETTSTIREISQTDLTEWLQLALVLWPDYEVSEMQTLLRFIYESPTQTSFLVRDAQGAAVGFMNLALRTDYVPGATQSPVAYVEGIYVQPAYQQQGIGRRLIRRAEEWARQQGCVELASDVLLDNTTSAAFHKTVGFAEVDRVISFIKTV